MTLIQRPSVIKGAFQKVDRSCALGAKKFRRGLERTSLMKIFRAVTKGERGLAVKATAQDFTFLNALGGFFKLFPQNVIAGTIYGVISAILWNSKYRSVLSGENVGVHSRGLAGVSLIASWFIAGTAISRAHETELEDVVLSAPSHVSLSNSFTLEQMDEYVRAREIWSRKSAYINEQISADEERRIMEYWALSALAFAYTFWGISHYCNGKQQSKGLNKPETFFDDPQNWQGVGAMAISIPPVIAAIWGSDKVSAVEIAPVIISAAALTRGWLSEKFSATTASGRPEWFLAERVFTSAKMFAAQFALEAGIHGVRSVSDIDLSDGLQLSDLGDLNVRELIECAAFFVWFAAFIRYDSQRRVYDKLHKPAAERVGGGYNSQVLVDEIEDILSANRQRDDDPGVNMD